jgi:uncharacterized protein
MSSGHSVLDAGFYLCYNADGFLETRLPGGGGVNLNNRHPLRINVGFLLHQGVGFSRNFDFDHPRVQVGSDLEVAGLKGSLRLTRTAQGLYAQGRLRASAPAECVRCLTEFDQRLEIEVADLFVYPPDQASDPLLSVPETGILDLSPLVREYLLLDIPLQPVCRSDCKGLCPECGNNLNETTCTHPTAGIDPRLSALKSLLPES